MSFELVYSIIVPTLTIIGLLYAGIEDILFREVRRDLIWILMIIAGLILDALYLIFAVEKQAVLLEMLLTVVLGFLIGFILVYAGFWGGADTKALWALSLLTPIHPFGTNLFGESQNILVVSSMVFSLLINSGLLAIFYPLVLMIINTISASKGSLFDEVRGSTSQKIRCFMFGYKKEVAKISEKKLHFDFLETVPEKGFEGMFEGIFEGRLDGKFIGLIQGDFLGEFSGKAFGLVKQQTEKPLTELELSKIIGEAEEIANLLEDKNEWDEIPNIILQKYRSDFSNHTEGKHFNSNDQIININGRITVPITGTFIGVLEGIFEGKIECSLVGKLVGDFKGISSKGKISGSKTHESNDWQIKIRMRMEDEEDIMEQRQLRTLWQLRIHEKKTVWVMPGLPFVFLMFIGYILYLLFGDIALQLFALLF